MNVKLTKGLAAAAVSAAMMLGAAAPALAAETATPIKGTEVPVKVTYDETGNGDAPEETISYTPTPGGSSFTGNAYYGESKPIPSVSIAPVTVDADGTGAAKSEGSLVVTVPDEYAAVGTYTYNFTRTAINDAGVTDNVPTGLTVVVTVTNKLDKDGNVLEGQFDRYVVIKDASNHKYDNEKGVNLSYAAGQLTVTKKVTGNLGDQSASNKFPFEIKLFGLDGKTVRGTYTYTVAGKDSGKPITFVDGKTTVDASIAHNESIVIEDLPAGVSYTVDELDGNKPLQLNGKSNGYTLANIDKADGSIVGADEDQATYTNEKTGEVKTGVLLNNAPYIAIIGGAAVVAIYVVNKRRHSDMD